MSTLLMIAFTYVVRNICGVSAVQRGVTTLVHHVSREGEPGTRGLRFGASRAAEVAHTVRFYRRLFAEERGLSSHDLEVAGGRVGCLLAQLDPDACAEIEGIARGAVVSSELLLAFNARTELLCGSRIAAGAGEVVPRPGECTTVGALPQAVSDETCLLAQNWDFHPDLAASRLVWSAVSQHGWFSTLTEAGLLGKIGVNGHGVALALNFLATDLDTGEGGLPVHIVARQVLERSRDLSDALRIVARARCRVSICFTLAFASGDESAIVAAEVAPNRISYVWPNEHGVLVHANHFRVRRNDDRFLGPTGHHDTLVREWYVERVLGGGRIDRERLQATLASRFNAPHAVCCGYRADAPWIERSETLASVVIDVGARRMWIASGRPDQVPYETIPAVA